MTPAGTRILSLRRQLAGGIAVAAILLATGIYHLHAELHAHARKFAAENLHAVALQKSAEVRRWLDDRLIFLAEPPGGLMATNLARLKDARDSAAASLALDARIRYLHRKNPELRSVWLYDRAGHALLGTSRSQPHPDGAHETAAREVLESGDVRFVDFHPSSSRPEAAALDILVPLVADARDDAASPIGYAMFEIDPAVRLYPLMRIWPGSGVSAETNLMRVEGNEIVYLNPLKYREAPPLSVRRTVDTPGFLIGRALRGEEVILDAIDYRGVPVLGVVIPIPGTDWLMTAKMDDAEIYDGAHRIFLWTILASLGFLGGLMLLVRSYLATVQAKGREAQLLQDVDRLETIARIEKSLAENGERLRLALKASNQGLFDIDVQTNEAIVSAEYTQMLGYGPDEFRETYAKWIDRLHPDDREVAEQHYRDYIEGRIPEFRIESRHRTNAGDWKWVLSVGSVIERDADGRPLRMIGTHTDITEQRRNEDRINALLEINAVGGVVPERELLDIGLRLAEKITESAIGFLHFVNDDQETIELVTWTPGALKGCTAAYDAHYPISRAGIWADCFREGRAVVFNDYPNHAGKHGLPEGHAHLQRLVSVPVIEEGKVRMMIGVGNKVSDYVNADIETVKLIGNDLWRIVRRQRVEDYLITALTEAQALNEKLSDAQSQLLQSEKMASIGQLAAGVAHELNNPIGFVSSNLGSLDSYLRDIFSIIAAYEAAEAAGGTRCPKLDAVRALKQEKDFDYLKTDIVQLMAESKDGLARVAKIVRDLKDFSRAGEAHFQWADLHQGLDSTLNIVWNELKYKCTVKKEYGELPQVWCVPSQLNQVFMNLLVNAAHAIPEKGDITIRTGRQGGEVFVAISDTGTGISPEHIKRIFDPFFTTKPVGKGTGLGLSLAYSIMQKHQGRIEVQSEVGKGTTFTVWLPIEAKESQAPEAPGGS